MFKPHLLILIVVMAGRLSAQQADTPAAGANAAADVSAEPATEPTEPAQTDTLPGAGEQEALANQLKPLLAEPTPQQTEAEAHDQLRQITDSAGQLAQASEEGPLRLKALSVQMQSLHARIVEFPETEKVDRLLSELRAAARQAKALEVEGAQAVGDFWLMIAELADMNRMPPEGAGGLSMEARREQSAELMREYLRDHPQAPPSGAVRASLAELEREAESTAESAEDAENEPPMNTDEQ